MQELPFRETVQLKDFCTFGIGGLARYFMEVRKSEEMQQAIIWCKKNQIPYLILGKGSNCLFDDRGFYGAVLLNKIEFMKQTNPGTFHVGAGYSFSLLGVQTARQGWSGLEFASGIPGSVGGAVYMNAGANGMETCSSLISVDFIDEEGIPLTIPKSDLDFSYRRSPFQKRGGAITGATFSLVPEESARKKQIEIINKRKISQPYGAMSAGCIFMNPPNRHAGALIDQCGLKGLSIGDAQVSQLHGNFLINAGGATCTDMQALISLVKTRVKEASGIDLHSEVRYIPYYKESSI